MQKTFLLNLIWALMLYFLNPTFKVSDDNALWKITWSCKYSEIPGFLILRFSKVIVKHFDWGFNNSHFCWIKALNHQAIVSPALTLQVAILRYFFNKATAHSLSIVNSAIIRSKFILLLLRLMHHLQNVLLLLLDLIFIVTTFQLGQCAQDTVVLRPLLFAFQDLSSPDFVLG